MFDPDRIPDILEAESKKAPPEAQAEFYLEFESLWERKLWHELTDLLLQYFKRPESASQRLTLFKEFIYGFTDKINQLKLINLGLLTAETIEGLWIVIQCYSLKAKTNTLFKTSKINSPSLKNSPGPSMGLPHKKRMSLLSPPSPAYAYNWTT